MITRPDPTIEHELAHTIHTDPRGIRCYVWAINTDGALMADIPTLYMTDTRRMAAEVHQMVEAFTIAGADPDVAGLVFGWRHDTTSPAVSLIAVGRDGSASERQWMTHPVDGLSARDGLVHDGVWCLASSCAATTAFRFATIGMDAG